MYQSPILLTPILSTKNQNVPFRLLNQKQFICKAISIFSYYNTFLVVGNQLQADFLPISS